MGALVTLGLSRVQKKTNNIKSVVRHMLVLSKEIRHQARLKSSTYRLVIDLNEKEPKYWVERTQGIVLRETPDERKKREDLEKRDSDDAKKKKDPFERDPRLTKKPIPLPPGLFFGQVEVLGMEQPAKTGTEYIYFSPEGFVEPSILQITDRKNLTWTLAFHPLTGQVDIIPEAKTLKELSK